MGSWDGSTGELTTGDPTLDVIDEGAEAMTTGVAGVVVTVVDVEVTEVAVLCTWLVLAVDGSESVTTPVTVSTT